ncbi:MAG: hypothetical protein JRJ87_18460 [Deltaproteobacteria bacterium]|nr:hypothetical protein [Deltaproteobacteria bacterium]
MKSTKVLIATFLVVAVGLVSAVSLADKMATQYKANLDQDVCKAMTRAADFLVKAQKPSENGVVGWSWVVGDGPVSGNVAGLAGLALIDAHQTSGKAEYLAAAKKYADGLVKNKTKWSNKNLPYKADIEFLMRMSTSIKNAGYQEAAKSAFGVIQAKSPKGENEVNRILEGRKKPHLLGFDVALAIRAAAAVSERRYAYQLADEVIRLTPKWYQPKQDPRFSLVSSAALVQALRTLDAGHYRKTIDRLQADLVTHQQENGSWLANETQPSAYAILALADGNPKEQAAYQRGIEWLKSTMLSKGAFASYNDHMPEPFVGKVISEVHAEALSALSKACTLK